MSSWGSLGPLRARTGHGFQQAPAQKSSRSKISISKLECSIRSAAVSIIKLLMVIEEQNERRAPFPPVTRSKAGTGKRFTCPLGFIATDGTGASSTSALPEAGSSTLVPASAEQLHHITRFGVIQLVLIQLQKFGKHFVNNTRPGRLMLSQSGSS